jgi:hypothetical protein
MTAQMFVIASGVPKEDVAACADPAQRLDPW